MMVVRGNHGSPLVEKVSVESEMFNLVAAQYLCPNKDCPYEKQFGKPNSVQFVRSGEKRAADHASVKGNSYRTVRERSVSIHKIQIMLLFATLENTRAQPFANPVYTCKGTLKSSLKHIQW